LSRLEVGPVDELAVRGPHAYLAGGAWGLRIIDVQDAESPIEVSTVDRLDTVNGVDVVDGLAFVAADEDGLIVFDVSDPSTPVEVASFLSSSDREHPDGLPIHASGVRVFGTDAFVSDHQGIHIVDVHDLLDGT
jgi:hypothetical protein